MLPLENAPNSPDIREISLRKLCESVRSEGSLFHYQWIAFALVLDWPGAVPMGKVRRLVFAKVKSDDRPQIFFRRDYGSPLLAGRAIASHRAARQADLVRHDRTGHR